MDQRTDQIPENLQIVQARIEQAAAAANRTASLVRLVVVTKAQPLTVVQAVIDAGATILGENYPEESLPKIQEVAASGRQVDWHMIGHLQSRKASIVSGHFQMLESLDSLRLAQKLDRLMTERKKTLPVLLEFNVGGEESKFGWPAWNEVQWEKLLPEIDEIIQMRGLAVRGLMTMPPLCENPEQSRPYFVRLRRLGEFLATRFGKEHFLELSMGTSADYEAAVQEGATLVRIGTAIVGPRSPKAQN